VSWDLTANFKDKNAGFKAFMKYINEEKIDKELWCLSERTDPPFGFRHHFFHGLGFGIPFCCSLRWSIEQKFNIKNRGRGSKKHKRPYIGVYIPCGIFHKRDED